MRMSCLYTCTSVEKDIQHTNEDPEARSAYHIQFNHS